MLFSTYVLLLLAGWGQAVVFNDTAGLLVDWGQIETDKDVTVSEGLEDSLIGSTAGCLLYTSPSPRDRQKSRMPSSA